MPNERTQVKATIRRAMLAAQQATNELDAQAMRELKTLYEGVLVEIQHLITQHADELGQVRLTQLNQLTRQLEEVLNQLHLTQSSMVSGHVVLAAKQGGNVFATSVATESVAAAIDSATMAVKHMKQKDGLQLSDRLWRVNKKAKEAVIGAVERAVILGQSASEAAQDFRNKALPIPSHISQQAQMANSASLNRTMASALMQDEGAPYYQIKRVMRTEINRAHGVAFQQAAFEDEFVAGTKFKLSPNHPRRDICDMHARVNLYGLGKGVYPKGKSPWPAHPNTISYEQVVFVDEITEDDKQTDGSRLNWLKRQSQAQQHAVLGHQKKVSALQKDLLTENMIATPWKHLEPALKRKGIDTSTL
ncbi:hypothetical protein [Vibrio sp. ER1A]|uniref:hypothetical protein n=1 Tax=Vibrio sp. ER1A TaxID=1517681 RepID=UPI0004DD2346|nr:hypothetical protein [Vibrio sp. ER1A]KFA98790.1 hypothetical protein HW45_07155 [Vibrio sp. ER1A]